MSFTLLYLTLALALIDWIAVAKNWKQLEYIAKPATMIALLAWFGLNGGFRGYARWFAAGLVFSLLGDILLMLPKDRFLAGLVSFLIVHIAYLVGLNQTPPPLNFASVILLILVLLTSSQIYHRIAQGLRASNKNKLIKPVLIYSIIISLMLLSALLTLVRKEWQPWSAILISLGALLFFISETFNAWIRFVNPLPYGRLRVMVTYHLGQILIALGALLHFNSLV